MPGTYSVPALVVVWRGVAAPAIPDAGEAACPGAGCPDYAIASAVMKPPTVALTDPTSRLRRLMENSSSLLIVLGI